LPSRYDSPGKASYWQKRLDLSHVENIEKARQYQTKEVHRSKRSTVPHHPNPAEVVWRPDAQRNGQGGESAQCRLEVCLANDSNKWISSAAVKPIKKQHCCDHNSQQYPNHSS